MTLNETDQRRRLQTVAAAAREEGCLVAPVGSLYFLLRGTGRPYTKDIDTVIHAESLEPVGLDVLKRIAVRLGTAQATVDEAVVNVKTEPGLTHPDVELIRGRGGAKGGFFPRDLLVQAAKRARREGNILVYPVEALLVLKADAVVDREERAIRDSKREATHRSRADVFRSDVFDEVNRSLLKEGLDGGLLQQFVGHLKAKRRASVARILAAAGAPIPVG